MFLAAFEQLHRLENLDVFRSWLLRIAGNLARSRLRRRRIIGWLSFDPATHDVADSEPGPDENLDAERRAHSVRTALAALPARQREALTLHRYQGLKYREIAGVMDTTVPGVESLIQRALATLRKELTGKVEMP